MVGLGYTFKSPMALKHCVKVGYILILSRRFLETDAIMGVHFALRVRACSFVGTMGKAAGVPKPYVGKIVGPSSLILGAKLIGCNCQEAQPRQPVFQSKKPL